MRKIIYENGYVCDKEMGKAHIRVNKYIEDWQNQGYDVDIQFAINNCEIIFYLYAYKMEG